MVAKPPFALAEPISFKLTSDQFAALNQVRSSSVRTRFCRTGSYFGVVPKKLANGRLAWPEIQAEKGGA